MDVVVATAADILLADRLAEVTTEALPNRVTTAGVINKLNPSTVVVPEEKSTGVARTAGRTITLTATNKVATVVRMTGHTEAPRAATDGRMITTTGANKPAMAGQIAAPTVKNKLVTVDPTITRTETPRAVTVDRKTLTAARNKLTANPTTLRTETRKVATDVPTTRMGVIAVAAVDPAINHTKPLRAVTDGQTKPTEAIEAEGMTTLMPTNRATMVGPTIALTKKPRVATDDLTTRMGAVVAAMVDPTTAVITDLVTHMEAVLPVNVNQMITPTGAFREATVGRAITTTLAPMANRTSAVVDMGALVIVLSEPMMTGLIIPAVTVQDISPRTRVLFPLATLLPGIRILPEEVTVGVARQKLVTIPLAATEAETLMAVTTGAATVAEASMAKARARRVTTKNTTMTTTRRMVRRG